jgi:mannose-6-phosphate isomerase-like protein (cupin superfamily)
MVCCVQNPTLDFAFPPNDKREVRPWGFFITHFTSEDKSVCFKTLVIECGHQISLQYHNFRSEFWYIPDENAHYELTVDENKTIFRGIRTVTILKGQTHCVLNMSSRPLIIYETQFAAGSDGKCLDSDIVRLSDPYADQR